MMIIAPQLKTSRLTLNDITGKDTEFIVLWRSNPAVYQFFLSPHPLTASEHQNWYETKYRYDENRFDWIAVKNDSSISTGIFGLKRTDESAAEAEISYLLAPEFQGKGYATEAVECMIKFASEKWFCNSVFAEIHKENQKSIKFAKKLGFSFSDISGDFARYKKKI